VDEGHNILLEDSDGLSPFHYALRCGSLDVLQFLSAACGNVLSKLWHSLDHHGNCYSRDKQYRKHLQCILGKDAEPFLMIGHTSGIVGSIVSVALSAVVTMTNSRDFGDASDFTAQLLIQALFDLMPWAKMEAELAVTYFRDRMEGSWKEDRRLTDS
jgi:hypothetical protein